jgi:hypothetical protein
MKVRTLRFNPVFGKCGFQWFRAWAEMMRWMEEFELKHAEFVRCIRSFQFMSVTWEQMASKATDPGYAAFGRQQADTYRVLCEDAEKLVTQHGEARFVKPVTSCCCFQTGGASLVRTSFHGSRGVHCLNISISSLTLYSERSPVHSLDFVYNWWFKHL